MALIAKVDPIPDLEDGNSVRVPARSFEQPRVSVGDRVYIWTSERSGGVGLVARGTVRRHSTDQFPNKTGAGWHNELVLNVELNGAHPNRQLSILQIGPYRDRLGPPAYNELSRVLYKHSHNKIVSVSAPTAEFLEAYFEGT